MTSLHLRPIVAGIGLRAHRATYGKIVKLRELDSADEQTIENATNDATLRLMAHAYKETEHYKSIFDSHELDYRELDVFERIPLLDKATLRREFKQLQAINAPGARPYTNSSGGSTGEPTRFVQDAAYKDWSRAVEMHFDAWTGYAPGRLRAHLWGSERDFIAGKSGARRRLIGATKNELWLNAFRMSAEDMRRHVAILNQRKPAFMLAYASSAYELARFIEARGLNVPRMRSIITSAGTLHHHMRRTIEDTFGCPVFNRYGSREVGGIACECSEQNGLHVSPVTQRVEVVRSDGTPSPPGEIGEIVVTPLTNLTMPLLRYRIGDLGIMSEGPCPCGRRWPRLAKVIGRTADVLVLPGGGVVLPEYVIHMLGVSIEAPWMRKFQVVQDASTDFRLLLEPYEPISEAIIRSSTAKMVARLKAVFGNRCTVQVELVEEIPLPDSGKHRYTVCNLPDR